MHGRPWLARGLVCLSRRTDRFTRRRRSVHTALCESPRRDHWQASPTRATLRERTSSRHRAGIRTADPEGEGIGARGEARGRRLQEARAAQEYAAMYTVSRGPGGIIRRTRRDLSQKLESLDQIRELRRKRDTTEDAEHTAMSAPRPVFQSVGGSKGGRGSTNGRAPNHDAISPQHEELIRYFNDSWGRVYKELEMSRQSGHDIRGSGIAYYQEKNVHPALQDFKPFDLEEFWGKRVYQNLTQS